MGKVKAVLAILAVGFVVALIVFNTINPVEPEVAAWNPAMSRGSAETGKHYVMYTDVFCPYCDKFSNALHANATDFSENFIDNGKVFYEIRVTDINYRNGHSENSRPGAEAAYCSAKQGKFWEYYEAILDRLYEDYHSKGIGVSKDSEKMPDLSVEYFYEVGETAEVDVDALKTCMEEDQTIAEIDNATQRAQRVIGGGVPYFVFGDYKASGFDGNWDTDNDYKQAKLMLEAGL